MPQRLDFKNDVNNQRRPNGQALHSIDQPDMADLPLRFVTFCIHLFLFR